MSYSPLCYRFRDQGERHEWWEGGKRGNFHFRFRPSHHPPVVFPQGKWNWIFIGYKVCGDSHIHAESCCISVNAEESIFSAVLGSSWSVRSLAKECTTHPLLLEPEIRTVKTLVMGSWRRKWTIIGTLSLIFQCFEPLVGDHTALTFNSEIAYRFRPVPGKALFGPRDPLKWPPLV